jgi:hypothetical protein
MRSPAIIEAVDRILGKTARPFAEKPVVTETSLTKKHFVRFAQGIKAMHGFVPEAARKMMASLVSDIAEEENPRFDRARFNQAAAVTAVEKSEPAENE